MSRTLPTECAHGAICDWGDFGGDELLPEHCPHGCNDDIPAPPLTDAAVTIAALAGIVKQRDAEIDHLRDAIWRLTQAAGVTA